MTWVQVPSGDQNDLGSSPVGGPKLLGFKSRRGTKMTRVQVPSKREKRRKGENAKREKRKWESWLKLCQRCKVGKYVEVLSAM
jgi:hypothetical protein